MRAAHPASVACARLGRVIPRPWAIIRDAACRRFALKEV